MGKRIVNRRRGRGGHVYVTPSHRHHAPNTLPRLHKATGEVIDITHNPGHNAPHGLVRLNDGTTVYLLAPEGLAVGDKISIGEGEPNVGSVLPIGAIPEGTTVFNIESKPGDGGKFCRSAGNGALLVSRAGNSVTVQLPSGRFRQFNAACRAIIGTVSGGGIKDKPILKAGKKHHMIRSKAKYWPMVRGVAKNPVDHPFGGGQKQHTGKPKTVARGTPPGRKVGSIAARRTGRGK